MRGCGDVCFARCQMIRKAGFRRCAEVGRRKGRKDPERDIEMIRKAEIYGYKTTAELMGCTQGAVASTVKVYVRYAEQILKEGKEWS